MAKAKGLKAPSGVSKHTMYAELVRKERRERHQKLMGDKWAGRAAGFVGAGGAAAFGGFAKKKGWGWMDIKGFDTRWILGGVSIGIGYWTNGMLSRGLEGAGYGFLAPALSDVIRGA